MQQSKESRYLMMISFFYFFLLAQASLSATSQKLPQPHNIFILAGQSNMAGEGGVYKDPETGTYVWDGIVPPLCQPSPSILRLSADLKWVTAREPLHADINYKTTSGIGPGMAFANAFLSWFPNSGATVGLVPCALAGTSISQWRKGGFLYNRMINRTKVAIKNRGYLQGLLWYQGESDTRTKNDAFSYGRRLEKFFNDVRTDLGRPELLIIQVLIESGDGPYIEAVRQAQRSINIPALLSVDAKGLQLGEDSLHLTTPAQVHLGVEMASVFLHPWPLTPQITGLKFDPNLVTVDDDSEDVSFSV